MKLAIEAGDDGLRAGRRSRPGCAQGRRGFPRRSSAAARWGTVVLVLTPAASPRPSADDDAQSPAPSSRLGDHRTPIPAPSTGSTSRPENFAKNSASMTASSPSMFCSARKENPPLRISAARAVLGIVRTSKFGRRLSRVLRSWPIPVPATESVWHHRSARPTPPAASSRGRRPSEAAPPSRRSVKHKHGRAISRSPPHHQGHRAGQRAPLETAASGRSRSSSISARRVDATPVVDARLARDRRPADDPLVLHRHAAAEDRRQRVLLARPKSTRATSSRSGRSRVSRVSGRTSPAGRDRPARPADSPSTCSSHHSSAASKRRGNACSATTATVAIACVRDRAQQPVGDDVRAGDLAQVEYGHSAESWRASCATRARRRRNRCRRAGRAGDRAVIQPRVRRAAGAERGCEERSRAPSRCAPRPQGRAAGAAPASDIGSQASTPRPVFRCASSGRLKSPIPNCDGADGEQPAADTHSWPAARRAAATRPRSRTCRNRHDRQHVAGHDLTHDHAPR